MLLALGFAVTPVMAHPAGANVADHGHPSATNSAGYTNDVNGDGTVGDFGNRVDLNADGDFDDAGEQVPLHNAHPMVTNITLKAGDAVRGTTAAVVADDAATTDVAENTFTLVIDFDIDIVNANNVAAVPALDTADPPDLTVGAQLVAADFATSLLEVDNTAVTGSSFVINRVADDNSQYEVVVTPGALPNADADDATANDNTLTFRIRVNAEDGTNGVFSLQTVVQRTDSVDPVTIPGGGNTASSVYIFTLVEALPVIPPTPPTPDTEGPDITVFDGPTPQAADSDGNIVFTLTFDESLGTGGLLPNHLTITGGTLAATGGITPAGAATTYTIKVTPTAAATEAEVTVTLNDGSVTDGDGNFYRAPATADPMVGIYDTVNPTINAVATGTINAIGAGTLNITFSEELGTATGQEFAHEDIDRVASTAFFNDVDPAKAATQPTDGTEVWTLQVIGVTGPEAKIVIKAGSVADIKGNLLLEDTIVTWTRPAPPTGDTTKPIVTLQDPKGPDSGSANEGPADDVVIDDSGGSITFTISDETALAAGAAVAMSEVSVSNGTVVSVSGNTITVDPVIADGANVNTTVTVTVAAGAIADAAGNMNDAVSETYSIGPIFAIPADTILVITKSGSGSATYDYLSDQPRLHLDQNPPTPAANIETAVWSNMPDLEVLFSFAAGGNGGTLSLIEAHRQAELPQTRDGDKQQKNSVRISEVMWASDLRHRGAPNDAEAAEQWVEISNDTGAAVRILMYARTGLDSAVNIDNDAEDRVGNAYNGGRGSAGWNVPGSNGNSWTGVNFVSMHRSYVTGDNRGYVNGTSSGHWHASDREYLTSISGNGEKLYDHVGSPGRPHGIGLPKPSTRAGTTNVPSSPVIINEVANRDYNNRMYEWIELRNVTDNEVNLRNWMISVVRATDDDKPMIQFPNNDNAKIAPQGVILLLASDPRFDDDHPIAVGYNVDVNANDQVDGLGLNVPDSNRMPPRQKVITFENDGLPDNNAEFVLILRKQDNYEGHRANAHGGKGVAETGGADIDKIIDVAGHHESLNKSNYPGTNPAGLNSTTLWPLVNFSGHNRPHRGHGDWNHRRHNRFDQNRVRYRQHVKTTARNDADGSDGVNRGGTGTTHKDEGVGHYAFRDAIYTGLGYKRTARVAGYNYGTPGYNGNSVGNTGVVKATTADAMVTISEIMYSTGPNADNPAYPQWIELYNSSPVNAVNLRGWKLRFEMLDADGNPMDSLLDLNFDSSRSVKTIQPQQTVLIVARRVAANSDSRTGNVFNENRVFNIDRDIGAGKFGANTRYMFFNPKRFHIALLDKDNKVVDAAGNLDGDARTSDQGNWDFPAGMDKDGNRRTSIIRVYDDGVARTGVNTTESHVMPVFGTGDKKVKGNDGIDEKWSWIPAVNTKRDFKGTIKHTWYGNEDDYGTPNNRPGMVLPVELSHFRPTLENGEVTIRWTTESELDNAGFNILRSETRNGEYTQVNTELIEGAGTTGERNTYKWIDQTAKPGVVYYYQIEDVSFAGERQALAITKLKGLISADNKLTTTWSELKASQ